MNGYVKNLVNRIENRSFYAGNQFRRRDIEVGTKQCRRTAPEQPFVLPSYGGGTRRRGVSTYTGVRLQAPPPLVFGHGTLHCGDSEITV